MSDPSEVNSEYPTDQAEAPKQIDFEGQLATVTSSDTVSGALPNTVSDTVPNTSSKPESEVPPITEASMDFPMDFGLPIPPTPTEIAATSSVRALTQRIAHEMRKTLVGQDQLVEMLVVAILAGGHVLLEGVPGTAKTLAIRTLARIFDVSFARIQFTPDLMPSDILGTSVFDPRTQQFNLKTGPIFAGLVLADEVNRTPPKTQSALLEAMEERRVTIDGVGHPLPPPFLVCATQNPIEYEGTYPLPEAQLDRFMLKVLVPYPTEQDEQDILARVQAGFRAQNLDRIDIQPALSVTDLPNYQAEVERVYCKPDVQKYIVDIVRATRANRHLIIGASPRAAITLLLTSKALAAMRGEISVTPDHVKYLAGPVLRHRLALRPESEIEGFTPDRVLEAVLQSVRVPL